MFKITKIVNPQSGLFMAIFLIISLNCVNAFNLSPKPNRIFTRPKLNISLLENESTYFGYALNLRESSIIVGAPRQILTDVGGFQIKMGAIFKCPFEGHGHASTSCKQMLIKGRQRSVTRGSKDTMGQWLGATIDGGFRDSDKLVVCAPRLIKYKISKAIDSTNEEFTYASGICYVMNNTLSLAPEICIVDSFVTSSDVRFGGSEQGFSVHMVQNKEEIVIGAPNNKIGMGSVIGWNIKTSQYKVINPYLTKKKTEYLTDLKVDYFGYSVSAGNFNTTLFDDVQYIASSPQANSLYGEVDIFNFESLNNDIGIQKYYTFKGTEFGAYFGYAILVEDLDNNGLSDVIITAPMYSTKDSVEQGAAYVYINKGNFTFERPMQIVSPFTTGSRFGTTISKLGDINGDGYNDVAIGAPYAENGTVFIYLGSPKGLISKHSQSLTVTNSNHKWTPFLFGIGLSNGYDIDKNGFNDFAIGAPNAETVYVFQAYPVVKVLLEFGNSTPEITIYQDSLDISLCFELKTPSEKIKEINITITCNLDPHHDRAVWQATQSPSLSMNKTATFQRQCTEMKAFLNITSIMPVEVNMKYDLIDKIPDTEAKFIHISLALGAISFLLGMIEFCGTCAALDPAELQATTKIIKLLSNIDLNVKSSGLVSKYTFGSRDTLALNVTYEITNFAEKAFEPKILVTSSNKMPFKNIPSSCEVQKQGVLFCQLNQGQPMRPKSKVNITIAYDLSIIEGSLVVELSANVSSSGNETNMEDNNIKDIIFLKKIVEANIDVKTNSTPEHGMKANEVEQRLKVQNKGLDEIELIQFIVEIPISYVSSETPIVDIESIEAYVKHPQQNRTQKLITNFTTDSQLDYKGSDNEENPKDILFDCIQSKSVLCTKAVFSMSSFLPNDTVDISINYHVNVLEMNRMFFDQKTHFVIITKLSAIKIDDDKSEVLKIYYRKRVFNKNIESVPTLVIILAIIGGMLVFTALTVGFYKVGFFERTKGIDRQSLVNEGRDITGFDNTVFDLNETEQNGITNQ